MACTTALFGGFRTSFVRPDESRQEGALRALARDLLHDSAAVVMLVVQLTLPYKDLRFVGYYFYLVAQDAGRPQWRALAYGFMGAMYYNAGRFALLLLPELSAFQRLVLYDVVGELRLYDGRVVHLLCLSGALVAARMIVCLFLRARAKVNLQIERVLLGDLRYFLCPLVAGVRIDVHLRRRCLLMLNTMQWFLIVEGECPSPSRPPPFH